jgi:hypothetical protein
MKNKNLRKYFMRNKEIFSRSIIRNWVIGISLILIIPILFNACEKFEDTSSIYKSEPASTNAPSITGIVPANIAAAGVREIKIVGQNLLGVNVNDTTSWIFVGGTAPKIKEIADDHITIYRPALPSNKYDKDIYINVTNPEAISISSSVAYKVESTGLFVQDFSFGTASYIAFESDKDDNLYILGDNRNLFFVSYSGAGTPPTQLGGILPTSIKNTSDMKFGPGPDKLNLYFAVGTKDIYRARADSVVTSKAPTSIIATLPGSGTASKIDFDANGNLYAGGKNGIYFVKRNADNSFGDILSCGYEGLNLKGIFVSKEYVYVADSIHVWKSLISADGTLGEKTELVNIKNNSELSSLLISSFVIDENNSIYLCIKGHPNYSLFLVESAQVITPYYEDANIIPGQNTEKLIWGSGRNLYLTKGSVYLADGKTRKSGSDQINRVYRLYMDKNGAAYNGRKFNQ